MSGSESRKGKSGPGAEKFPRPVPAAASPVSHPEVPPQWVNPVNPIDLDTPESISRFVATEEALERQARREAREEHADARTEVVRAEGELIQARANSLNRSAEKRGAEADLLRFERVERIFLMVVNAIFAILLVTGVLVGAEFLGRVVAAAAAFNGLMGALRLIRTYRSDRGGDSPLKATGGQVPPP